MKISISYDKINDCINIWSWIYYEWSFINKYRKRESGFRLFGFCLITLSTLKEIEE